MVEPSVKSVADGSTMQSAKHSAISWYTFVLIWNASDVLPHAIVTMLGSSMERCAAVSDAVVDAVS